jgi:hypothetical protein
VYSSVFVWDTLLKGSHFANYEAFRDVADKPSTEMNRLYDAVAHAFNIPTIFRELETEK